MSVSSFLPVVCHRLRESGSHHETATPAVGPRPAVGSSRPVLLKRARRSSARYENTPLVRLGERVLTRFEARVLAYALAWAILFDFTGGSAMASHSVDVWSGRRQLAERLASTVCFV
jgi:hypothetical protein